MFDFDGNCYGERIKVRFVEKVRRDMHFDSFEEMAKQIKRDCEQARNILARIAESAQIE